MGAKPYQAYKDSGVEWIGDIPEHWEVKRLRNVLSGVYSGGTPTSDNNEFYSDDGVFWVNISDITRCPHVMTTSKRLSPSGVLNKKLKVLPIGTILLTMYASLGKPAKLCVAATISQAILALFLKPNVFDDYLIFFLEHSQSYLALYSTANTQANLSAERVCKLPLVLPEFEEQKLIASFLYRETGKIDTLVEQQQQLITLLKEKRQSLISHIVTKGLNPNVRMKDSGVEWIGDIPEHWEVKALSQSVMMRTGPFGSALHRSDYVDDGIPVVNPMHIVNGRIIPTSEMSVTNLTAEKLSEYRLNIDDIVMGRRGDMGRCAVVTVNEIGWLCGTGSVVIRCNRFAVPVYYQRILSSPRVINELEGSSIGSTMINLNQVQLGSLKVPTPPVEEQKQIATFLDRETSKIDQLIVEANQSIVLLKERRSSLISAAVTGKIDVRVVA